MTDPLRTVLDDLAASAPADVLDTDGVRRRIRRRRRVRQGAYGGAAVLTAAAAGVAGAVVLTPGDGADTPAVAKAAPAPVEQVLGGDGCGQPVTMAAAAMPVMPLEMTVDLEPSVDRLHTGPIGTVTITNVSDETVDGHTAVAPSVTVAKDGVTVTPVGPQRSMARTVSLAPGESTTYDVWTQLRQCTLAPTDPSYQAGLSDPDHPPLQPGTREVYVEWGMTTNEAADSAAGRFNDITLYSGPIEIEVR